MNAFRPVALIGVGVLLGYALGWAGNWPARAKLNKELEVLRADLGAAQQAQSETELETQRWKEQAEQARRGTEEVFRLRAEMSRLQGELKNPQLQPAGKTGEQVVGPSGAQGKFRQAVIPLESAPAAVGAAITREMAGGAVRGVLATAEDGRTIYGVKGQLPDGRAVALQVAEDGTLLERSLEIATSNIPAHIQDPVSQTFGQILIDSAREVVDGGKTLYQLAAKSPEARMEITVRGDGTILGYSAKLRVPEK
jgi:hypothetical protein